MGASAAYRVTATSSIEVKCMVVEVVVVVEGGYMTAEKIADL